MAAWTRYQLRSLFVALAVCAIVLGSLTFCWLQWREFKYSFLEPRPVELRAQKAIVDMGHDAVWQGRDRGIIWCVTLDCRKIDERNVEQLVVQVRTLRNYHETWLTGESEACIATARELLERHGLAVAVRASR